MAEAKGKKTRTYALTGQISFFSSESASVPCLPPCSSRRFDGTDPFSSHLLPSHSLSLLDVVCLFVLHLGCLLFYRIGNLLSDLEAYVVCRPFIF